MSIYSRRYRPCRNRPTRFCDPWTLASGLRGWSPPPCPPDAESRLSWSFRATFRRLRPPFPRSEHGRRISICCLEIEQIRANFTHSSYTYKWTELKEFLRTFIKHFFQILRSFCTKEDRKTEDFACIEVLEASAVFFLHSNVYFFWQKYMILEGGNNKQKFNELQNMIFEGFYWLFLIFINFICN